MKKQTLSHMESDMERWLKVCSFWLYSSSSVYSPFSDRVGLPPHNTFFPRVLMKSIGAVFLRPDALLPGVNHMRGMQYQIVLNFTFWMEVN